MSFPLNPTNGQQTQVNGVVYTYSSAKDAWTVGTLFVGNVTVDQINANSVVSAGNISGSYILGNGSQLTGIDATSIQNGNSNVRVLANSDVVVGVAGVANSAIFGSTGLTLTGDVQALFYTSAKTISSNVTIDGNINAMSPGPITIADGVTVIIADGGEWSIV